MINSFIYPDIKKQDRRYAGIAGDIINPKGDWRDFLTPFETQNRNGVESSACYVEANQSCVAILKEYMYGIKDENYSARFNALLSGGTEVGGDPLKAGYSIKKDGLIPQSMMDWGGVNSWDYFHSWEGVDKDKCIAKGQEEAIQWDKKYYILFEKNTPIEVKYNNIRQALKRSPVAISVYAWLEKDGKYYKPNGTNDTHLVSAIVVGFEDNCIIIKDTYEPFLKTLSPDFNPDFGMFWIIHKRTKEEVDTLIHRSFIDILKGVVKLLNDFLKTTSRNIGDVVAGIFSTKN